MATKAPAKSATAGKRDERPGVLDEIFADVKGLLAKYAPPFEVRSDAKAGYHLWKTKPIVIDGRKRKEVYFAGVIPQQGYVGLYYMPVYVDADVKAMFKPELLSVLKGKSCFHLKERDPVLMRQIKSALADGFKMYKREGWV